MLIKVEVDVFEHPDYCNNGQFTCGRADISRMDEGYVLCTLFNGFNLFTVNNKILKCDACRSLCRDALNHHRSEST